MKRLTTKLCVFTAFWFVGSNCMAGSYQNLVISMDPTYYYELNETDTSTGAVDTMGRGPTGTYNGDYDVGPEVGIPGPDFLIEGGAWTFTAEWDDIGDEIPLIGLGEDNLAHASNNQGHITLGDGNDFAANAMTVAMFAKGGGNAQGGDRLFTNNVGDPLTSFQIVVGNDGIVVSTNPTVECSDDINCGHRSLFFPGEGVDFSNQGADRGLISPDNGWWHIVAATHGTDDLERTENIRLWLNGVDRTEDMLPGTVGWGINTGMAKIGGRRANPTDTTTHSGAQDEVAIWLDRTLTDAEALNLYEAAIGNVVLIPCDFDGDGELGLGDIAAMTAEIQSGNNTGSFDLNGDNVVDGADLAAFVTGEDKLHTWIGDANLDGEFNSTDFVEVFQAGEYEDGVAGNSTWATGDWNGDGEFDSSDFVVAFQDGGFELGPRWTEGVASVPEPSAIVLILIGVGCLLKRNRK